MAPTKAAAAQQKPEQAEPELQPIAGVHIKPREFSNNDWCARYSRDLSGAELVNPALWAAAPSQIQAGDIIRVFTPSFFAELLVRKWILGSVAQVVVLRRVKMPDEVTSNENITPDNHEILHDNARGWIVRRVSDGVEMGCQQDKPELSSRGACLAWLNQHVTLKQSVR